MQRYYTFTVDAVGNDEDIVAQGLCTSISLRQLNLDDATLLPFVVTVSGIAANYQAGATSDPIQGTFSTNDKAGKIRTGSGSATFLQIEEFVR